MAQRLPWGHESRRCVYCGRVGPRMVVLGGYAHKYCLPKEVLRELRKIERSGETK
jgi:hypothetical protein